VISSAFAKRTDKGVERMGEVRESPIVYVRRLLDDELQTKPGQIRSRHRRRIEAEGRFHTAGLIEEEQATSGVSSWSRQSDSVFDRTVKFERLRSDTSKLVDRLVAVPQRLAEPGRRLAGTSECGQFNETARAEPEQDPGKNPELCVGGDASNELEREPSRRAVGILPAHGRHPRELIATGFAFEELDDPAS
jgi:hypothetical protein